MAGLDSEAPFTEDRDSIGRDLDEAETMIQLLEMETITGVEIGTETVKLSPEESQEFKLTKIVPGILRVHHNLIVKLDYELNELRKRKA